MVKIIGGVPVIGMPDEPRGLCAFCKQPDELRPYGPNDELICFDCAMKDEETAKRKFRQAMEGGGNA